MRTMKNILHCSVQDLLKFKKYEHLSEEYRCGLVDRTFWSFDPDPDPQHCFIVILISVADQEYHPKLQGTDPDPIKQK